MKLIITLCLVIGCISNLPIQYDFSSSIEDTLDIKTLLESLDNKQNSRKVIKLSFSVSDSDQSSKFLLLNNSQPIQKKSHTKETSFLKEDNKQSTIARVVFTKELPNTGWDKLHISTSKPANSYEQSFLAGYLEGRVTAREIHLFHKNLISNNESKVETARIFEHIKQFFKELSNEFNHRVENSLLKELVDSEDYWSKLLLGWAQFKGLVAGYNKSSHQMGYSQLADSDFLMLQADGELIELMSKPF